MLEALARAASDVVGTVSSGLTISPCGNGVLDPGEICDDGYNDHCGSCNSECTAVGNGAICGDGVYCPELEACDDGATDACGPCNAECSAAGSGSICGDGVVCASTELCDDGYADACGTCNVDCTAAGTGATCGDGVLCAETEVCDDGYTDACGTCNADCTAAGSGATCGDGDLCAESEVCDDGNTDDDDYCSSDCGTEEGACGDGTLQSNELCDDGNTTNGDGCPATCDAVRLTCASDAFGSLLTGAIDIGPGTDFVAACDGWVFYSDTATHRIILLNAITGHSAASYQLTAAPGDLELDAANRLLFATQSARTAIARIDIDAGTLSEITVGGDALDMAMGSDGILFATFDNPGASFDVIVAVVDGISGIELSTTHTDGSEYLIAYDAVAEQIALGGKGTSGLSMYQYDPGSLDISLRWERFSAGITCQDLAFSHDGLHLAYACRGGNTDTSYGVLDIRTACTECDPQGASCTGCLDSAGVWSVGAYPDSASFSPDDTYLLATNGDELQVFDVATHAMVNSTDLVQTGCSYFSTARVDFSAGGDLVFMRAICGSDDDSGRLFIWAPGR